MLELYFRLVKKEKGFVTRDSYSCKEQMQGLPHTCVSAPLHSTRVRPFCKDKKRKRKELYTALLTLAYHSPTLPPSNCLANSLPRPSIRARTPDERRGKRRRMRNAVLPRLSLPLHQRTGQLNRRHDAAPAHAAMRASGTTAPVSGLASAGAATVAAARRPGCRTRAPPGGAWSREGEAAAEEVA
jgi:hypothetical protein